MCVIIVMEDKIPSLDIFKKCEKANKDGGGISWVQDNKVHFKKGIDAVEMHGIAEAAGGNCIAHFRISTIGGTPKELCHPFIVSRKSEILLEGATDKVLFHNGIWNKWDEYATSLVINNNLVFPTGQWSDSRAMAWIAGNSNQSFLKLLYGQRVAVQTAKNIYLYGSWDEKGGVKYSNLNWDKHYYDYGWRNSGYQHPTETQPELPSCGGGETKAETTPPEKEINSMTDEEYTAYMESQNVTQY